MRAILRNGRACRKFFTAKLTDSGYFDIGTHLILELKMTFVVICGYM